MRIGLYNTAPNNIVVDETSSTCMGGSETWLIEIAKQLSNRGHQVYLFGNSPHIHAYGGIHFIDRTLFPHIIGDIGLDKLIYSRGIEYRDLVPVQDVSVILHDMYSFTDIDPSTLRHIYVLSRYDKERLIGMGGGDASLADKIVITFNGVDQSLYHGEYAKTNSMVWSSVRERGLPFFLKYVYPLIKEAVPDFELKICSYENYDDVDNGTNLGRLDKRELAIEQMKAKIWCYPNLGFSAINDEELHHPYDQWHFHETFCISAVENALAGNCILTTPFGGLGTTCDGIEFMSSDFYKDGIITDFEGYGNYLASKCIDALNGKFFTTFDASKFTWENAANTLLD